MEPCSTDTRLIRTPALYGQFRLFQQKAYIFSLKVTRFIRTPGNKDNGHFLCPESDSHNYIVNPTFWTLYCAQIMTDFTGK